jgi:protein CpxP
MNTRNWRLAAGTALLALCAGIAYAQAPDSPPPPPNGQSAPPTGEMGRARGPEEQLKNLTRVLTLTEDQQKGVRAVLEQQATQMRALRAKSQAEGANNDTPEARQARMTQMNQIRDESNTKIAALLDDNQKKTFADWEQRRKAGMERRQSRGQSRDGQPPSPPPNDGAPPPPPPNE